MILCFGYLQIKLNPHYPIFEKYWLGLYNNIDCSTENTDLNLIEIPDTVVQEFLTFFVSFAHCRIKKLNLTLSSWWALVKKGSVEHPFLFTTANIKKVCLVAEDTTKYTNMFKKFLLLFTDRQFQQSVKM